MAGSSEVLYSGSSILAAIAPPMVKMGEQIAFCPAQPLPREVTEVEPRFSKRIEA